jgi:hypothetical protein
MCGYRTRLAYLLVSLVSLGLLPGSVLADASQIKAQQRPGEFEILEGAALQLRGQEPKTGRVTGYKWRIIAGEGGKLIDADTMSATFYVAKASEPVQLYQIELVTSFADGKKTTANILVRVHKRPGESSKGDKKVVYRNRGPWLGFGFGFGMGYLWNYPIYVPIIIPIPPNEVWPPDLQPPVEPQPFAEEDMADLPADLLPEDIYAMEDFGLLADQLPELNDLSVDSYETIDGVDGGDMAIEGAVAEDMMIEDEVLDDPVYNDYPEPGMDDLMRDDPMMDDMMMDDPMMDDMMY